MDHIREDEIYPVSVSEDDGAAPMKILVKLKLGKTTASPPEDQEKKHYCKECDKAFASGKALGGHMSSAHVQANKDYSDRKLSSKTKRHITFSGTAADITCNLCGKGFPSEKSLFGHMRCHPERCYRGMEPPATSSPPTSSDDDSGGGQIVSAPVDLKSWPPGIKRGRGPYGIHVRAAHEIVRMVGNGPPKRARSGCDSDVESPMWDEDDERVRTAVEVLKHMKRGEKHTCDLCNKGFTSHQALGGHMSSHTKLKVNNGQPKTMSDDDGSSGSDDKIKPSDGKVVIGFDLNVMPDEEEE